MEEFKRRMWAAQSVDVPRLLADTAAAATPAERAEHSQWWRPAPLRLPRVHIRGLGDQVARLETYREFGISFEEERFAEFPFAFQQQSAARWVDGSTPEHHGRYSVWRPGEVEQWWAEVRAHTFDFTDDQAGTREGERERDSRSDEGC